MHRRPPVLVALLTCLALLVGACGGGDDDDAGPDSTAGSTTSTTAPPAAPLTGLPLTDLSLLDKPALIVKMDNVEPKARPQYGINQADVVYEERVEGSVTRLLTIFHSGESVPAGPVRSARTSDIGIFTPLNRPLFAWSGANEAFARRIRAAAVIDLGVDVVPGEYTRDRSRPAPSNLMLKSTAALRAMAPEGSGAPPALFTYRASGTVPAHLEQVAGAHVRYGTMPGSAPVDYRWNGEGWARSQKGTPHVDAAGVQVAPANVIIQFVRYLPTDTVDQFGKPIPEAEIIGEGDVWILTAGGLVVGRWAKPSVDAITRYTDVDGNPIGLTPGRTWLALTEAGEVTRL